MRGKVAWIVVGSILRLAALVIGFWNGFDGRYSEGTYWLLLSMMVDRLVQRDLADLRKGAIHDRA